MDNKINLWSKIIDKERYERLDEMKNSHNLGILGAFYLENKKELFTIGGDYLVKVWNVAF